MSRRSGGIAESFVTHSKSMVESLAWRAMPNNARRVVERLELEHMRHAGTRNGHLICTYDDFATWGIRRPSIALAIRQAVALGFVVVTQQGFRNAGGTKVPSTYRITHVYNKDHRKDGLPTDEWKKLDRPELVLVALETAKTGSTLGSSRSGKGKPRPQGRKQGGIEAGSCNP